jgi:putative PIN family toxin of toxin-antitoxin system
VKPPRIVFDAGVLVSALLDPGGPAGSLLRHLAERRSFELILTEEILEEVHRALADRTVARHLDRSPERVVRLEAALGLLATFVDPSAVQLQAGIVADPEDEKYLVAARAGEAPVIVSNDPHLLELEHDRELQVVTPRVFLDVLEINALG